MYIDGREETLTARQVAELSLNPNGGSDVVLKTDLTPERAQDILSARTAIQRERFPEVFDLHAGRENLGPPVYFGSVLGLNSWMDPRRFHR